MVKLHIYFTDQQVAAMRQLARARGLTFSEMVRRIVDAGLEVVLVHPPSRDVGERREE